MSWRQKNGVLRCESFLYGLEQKSLAVRACVYSCSKSAETQSHALSPSRTGIFTHETVLEKTYKLVTLETQV